MSQQTLPAVVIIEGEALSDAALNSHEMAHMNFAREEYKKLETILLHTIIPALGGYENPLASDIRRHVEQVKTFSGNFCWLHRHLGNSQDATKVGGAQ